MTASPLLTSEDIFATNSKAGTFIIQSIDSVETTDADLFVVKTPPSVHDVDLSSRGG